MDCFLYVWIMLQNYLFSPRYYRNEIIITNIMMAETNCDGSVSDVQIWIVTGSL